MVRVAVPPTWRSRLSRGGALHRAEPQEGQDRAQPLLHHGRRREFQRAVPQVQRRQRRHAPCGEEATSFTHSAPMKRGRDDRAVCTLGEKNPTEEFE